jgi:starvation-inducible DNA-binding protein
MRERKMSRFEPAESVASSRKRLHRDLQVILVDLMNLALDGKQANWHVVGEHVRSVHRQLDQLVDDVRGWTDLLAERAATLGLSVDGRAATLARAANDAPPLPDGWVLDRTILELMAERVEAVAEDIRVCLAAIGEADPDTQDLVLEVLQGLEKHEWMLSTRHFAA